MFLIQKNMYSKKIRASLYLFVTIFTCFSCSGQSKNISSSEKDENIEQGFRMVAVPENLKEPKERANYLVQHYWDNYDFQDTSYIHRPEVSEQALVDYLQILPIADQSVVDLAIAQTLKNAEQENRVLRYFLELYKKYLYDPTSPQKNEEYYIVVLETMLNSDSIDEMEKVKAQFDLDMLLKNRLGEPALNITYALASGNKSSLYGLNKEYTILMFYDPDCHACGLTTDYMKDSPILQKALNAQLVDILAVYPGENKERWQEYSANVPATWINGFDESQSIHRKRMYELRALPTIYLLDKDKKVVLKDVSAGDVETYLVNNKPIMFGNM